MDRAVYKLGWNDPRKMTKDELYKDYMSNRPPFNPPKYKCASCGDIIFSIFPGEMVGCRCGEIAVDSTEHYTRLIGDYKMFIQIPNDNNSIK